MKQKGKKLISNTYNDNNNNKNKNKQNSNGMKKIGSKTILVDDVMYR